MSENTQNESEVKSDDIHAEVENESFQDEAGSNDSGDAEVETVESVKEQLLQVEAKAAEQIDMALRAKAEADNIRRRAERDVQNAHKYALEGFVGSLLPVLDSLEQGLAQPADSDEAKALKEGMELTLKMFVDVLAKKNVVQLNPEGESFNPELHEAMSMQENPDLEPNTVIAVFQKGYTLNGRLVRPARVVVNKGKAPSVDTKA